MKTNIYILALLTTTLVCSSILLGCKQESSETTITVEEIPIETVESISTETIIETESEEATTELIEESVKLKSITISVLNLSNVNVGMFSVIDPATGAQINVDSLESGSSVSLECNWPADIEKFHWALYNDAGELCIDASTDISNANKAVALMLTGNGTIEDVEVLSE